MEKKNVGTDTGIYILLKMDNNIKETIINSYINVWIIQVILKRCSSALLLNSLIIHWNLPNKLVYYDIIAPRTNVLVYI